MNKQMKQHLEAVVEAIIFDDAAAAKDAFHNYLSMKTQSILVGESAECSDDEADDKKKEDKPESDDEADDKKKEDKPESDDEADDKETKADKKAEKKGKKDEGDEE